MVLFKYQNTPQKAHGKLGGETALLKVRQLFPVNRFAISLEPCIPWNLFNLVLEKIPLPRQYRCTRATTVIADLPVQIFGGRGVTKARVRARVRARSTRLRMVIFAVEIELCPKKEDTSPSPRLAPARTSLACRSHSSSPGDCVCLCVRTCVVQQRIRPPPLMTRALSPVC